MEHKYLLRILKISLNMHNPPPPLADQPDRPLYSTPIRRAAAIEKWRRDGDVSG